MIKNENMILDLNISEVPLSFENLKSMNIKMVIAVITITISIISIIISIRSNWIAKKSWRLSKKIYKESLSNFDLNYNKGFRKVVQERCLLLFNVTVRNKSKSTNSFSANLEIEYQREDDSISKIIIEHSSELSNLLTDKEFIIYPKDIVLDAGNSTTMWLIFEQHDIIDCSKYRINNYCIKFTDLSGHKTSVEAVILKNID